MYASPTPSAPSSIARRKKLGSWTRRSQGRSPSISTSARRNSSTMHRRKAGSLLLLSGKEASVMARSWSPEEIEAAGQHTARRQRARRERQREQLRHQRRKQGAEPGRGARARGALDQRRDDSIVAEQPIACEEIWILRDPPGKDGLGTEPARYHGRQDPFAGDRVGEPQRIADHCSAAALAGGKVLAAEEMVRMAFDLVERRVARVGKVPTVLEEGAGLPPGREQRAGLDGAAAHVHPARLGDVPRVPAQIVVQEDLGLAIPAHAARGDGASAGLELAFLSRHRLSLLAEEELPCHRTVGPAPAHQEACGKRAVHYELP